MFWKLRIGGWAIALIVSTGCAGAETNQRRIAEEAVPEEVPAERLQDGVYISPERELTVRVPDLESSGSVMEGTDRYGGAFVQFEDASRFFSVTFTNNRERAVTVEQLDENLILNDQLHAKRFLETDRGRELRLNGFARVDEGEGWLADAWTHFTYGDYLLRLTAGIKSGDVPPQEKARLMEQANLALDDLLAGLTLHVEAESRMGIHAAARFGDLERVRGLIESEPTLLESRDPVNSTPLHSASGRGHSEVVRFLLAEGAEVDPTNDRGQTPLHLAAAYDRTEVASILLDSGAEIEASADGSTPLLLAAENGSLAAVEFLLSRGANPDGAPGSDFLPLSHVARGGYDEVVERLLSAGASADWLVLSHTMSGHSEKLNGISTPWGHHRASNAAKWSRDYRRVIELVLAHGGEATPDLLSQTTSGDRTEFCRMFLDAGADPNQGDSRRRVPLHEAAERGSEGVAKLLIEHGAHPDAEDDRGWRPLQEAAREGHAGMVALLLDAGADIDHKTQGGGSGQYYNDGNTALEEAAHWNHLDVVRLLVERGADVNMEFANDRTPLYWAKQGGHDEIVDFLTAHGARK